jgi:hypothetical protein
MYGLMWKKLSAELAHSVVAPPKLCVANDVKRDVLYGVLYK